MSRICYHVKKKATEINLTPNQLEKITSEVKENIKNSEIIREMTDNDLIDYISNSITSKIEYFNSNYTHTLMFEFVKESNTLFVSWSKARNISEYWKDDCGDTFSKKQGYKIANMRMDRLINYTNGDKDFYGNDQEIPDIVRNSIEEYLPRVKSYFKEMLDDFDMVIY